MIVAKFGGSSVKDAEAFKRCFDIINSDAEVGVVILSATFNTTNDLELFFENKDKNLLSKVINRHLDLANDLNLENDSIQTFFHAVQEKLSTAINKEDTKEEVLACGELMSSFLFYHYLVQVSDKSIHLVDARTVIEVSDQKRNLNWSKIKENAQSLIGSLLKRNTLVVTQGYIAETQSGRTVTLGREGSDYSAAIIASALSADEVNIWTDIDGVYSADPRIVKKAVKLPILSYDQASLLATAGAKVLFPRTLEPLRAQRIPLRVLSSLKPSEVGTLIQHKETDTMFAIAALRCNENSFKVTIFNNDLLSETFDCAESDLIKVLNDGHDQYCL